MLHRTCIVVCLMMLMLAAGCLNTVENKQINSNKPLNNTTLWYEQPAGDWNDGLPVGNGQIGAMILGSVGRERIALNHNRLWREIKEPLLNNPRMGHLRGDIQKLFFEGKIDEAVSLSRIGGSPWHYGYQPFGDLFINFSGHELENISNYRSELDLATRIAKVSYVHDGVTYIRETFASRVDDVIVVRLSASKKGSITGDIRL